MSIRANSPARCVGILGREAPRGGQVGALDRHQRAAHRPRLVQQIGPEPVFGRLGADIGQVIGPGGRAQRRGVRPIQAMQGEQRHDG
jgi:hypothetical protein